MDHRVLRWQKKSDNCKEMKGIDLFLNRMGGEDIGQLCSLVVNLLIIYIKKMILRRSETEVMI